MGCLPNVKSLHFESRDLLELVYQVITLQSHLLERVEQVVVPQDFLQSLQYVKFYHCLCGSLKHLKVAYSQPAIQLEEDLVVSREEYMEAFTNLTHLSICTQNTQELSFSRVLSDYPTLISLSIDTRLPLIEDNTLTDTGEDSKLPIVKHKNLKILHLLVPLLTQGALSLLPTCLEICDLQIYASYFQEAFSGGQRDQLLSLIGSIKKLDLFVWISHYPSSYKFTEELESVIQIAKSTLCSTYTFRVLLVNRTVEDKYGICVEKHRGGLNLVLCVPFTME